MFLCYVNIPHMHVWARDAVPAAKLRIASHVGKERVSQSCTECSLSAKLGFVAQLCSRKMAFNPEKSEPLEVTRGKGLRVPGTSRGLACDEPKPFSAKAEPQVPHVASSSQVSEFQRCVENAEDVVLHIAIIRLVEMSPAMSVACPRSIETAKTTGLSGRLHSFPARRRPDN